MSAAVYRHAEVGGCLDATLELRADGTQLLRSTEELAGFRTG
jgi:feruloyl-CoA synthase